MKVAFCQVPAYGTNMPALGLAYVASNLKSKGHTVKIFDYNIDMYFQSNSKTKLAWHHGYLENDQIWMLENGLQKTFPGIDDQIKAWCSDILKYDPKVIGFSACFTQELLGIKLASYLKKANNKIKIIFGGPTFFDINKVNEFKQYDFVDSIVIGEGELAFEELVSKINKNMHINKVIISEMVKDLNSLPFPDWSMFDLTKYDEKGVVVIGGSRGCTHKCTFCIEHGNFGAYRQRSAESIFNEMKNDAERFGIVNIAFNDSLINGNIKVLERWVDLLLESNLELNWNGNARISPRMTFGLLRKMKKAGCQHLIYGIESASQKVLDKMQKGFDINDAETVLRNTRKAGIIPITNWIIGFPNENTFDFLKSIFFVYKLRKHIKVGPPWGNPYVFLPNSEIYENKKEYGILIDGTNWVSSTIDNNPIARNLRVKLFRKLVRHYGLDAFS